ncbi:hypothetical protein N9882_03565 [Akkermansiaceae bacterium]|nr:hypothetical protein [Akkermansiaceae bacterium]
MSLLGGAENPLEVDFSASLETPKSVMKFIARTLPIAALALSLLFCEEEDKKLKAQLDKQALEIQAKEAELKMVRHDVAANRIDDPTEELAEITLKVDEAIRNGEGITCTFILRRSSFVRTCPSFLDFFTPAFSPFFLSRSIFVIGEEGTRNQVVNKPSTSGRSDAEAAF